MNSEVKRDLSNSSGCFMNYVWPKIRPILGYGQLVQVEGTTQPFLSEKFDQLAGIDAWHIVNDQGIRGIASRIQKKEKSYDTFTVRYRRQSGAETEFEKRKRALNNQPCEFIFPYWTVQGYTLSWDGPILSIGLAKTRDIFDCITKGLFKTQQSTDKSGWSEFLVVDWYEMRENNFPVTIIKDEIKELCLL